MTPKTKTIFRNFHLVRQTYEDSQPEEEETDNTDSDNPKDNQTHRYKKVSISHDMTATQRKDLKRLQNEAKAQEEKMAGEYRFRVRGPPWALKIVKLAAQKNNKNSTTKPQTIESATLIKLIFIN